MWPDVWAREALAAFSLAFLLVFTHFIHSFRKEVLSDADPRRVSSAGSWIVGDETWWFAVLGAGEERRCRLASCDSDRGVSAVAWRSGTGTVPVSPPRIVASINACAIAVVGTGPLFRFPLPRFLVFFLMLVSALPGGTVLVA